MQARAQESPIQAQEPAPGENLDPGENPDPGVKSKPGLVSELRKLASVLARTLQKQPPEPELTSESSE